MKKLIFTILIILVCAISLNAQVEKQAFQNEIETLESQVNSLLAEMTTFMEASPLLKDTFDIPGMGTINIQEELNKTFPQGIPLDEMLGTISKEVDKISEEDWTKIQQLFQQLGIEELRLDSSEAPVTTEKKRKTYRM